MEHVGDVSEPPVESGVIVVINVPWALPAGNDDVVGEIPLILTPVVPETVTENVVLRHLRPFVAQTWRLSLYTCGPVGPGLVATTFQLCPLPCVRAKKFPGLCDVMAIVVPRQPGLVHSATSAATATPSVGGLIVAVVALVQLVPPH